MPSKQSRQSDGDDELVMAQDRIEQLEQLVAELMAEPFAQGPVIAVDEERKLVTTAVKGDRLELTLRKGMTPKVGQIARLNLKTMQIVELISRPPALGPTGLVMGRVSERTSRVQLEGSIHIVVHSHDIGEVEEGDQVIMDASGLVILANMGKDDSRFALHEQVNVDWDNIGGLEEAKEALREVVEYPYTHAPLYAHYNRQPLNGMVLLGPPGCGKTLLAKAAATAQGRHFNGNAGSHGFIYVKGSEILTKWVGESEANVRGFFARAYAHYRKHKYPALIFIDEADAVLGRRGMGISSDVERTIVPAFLSEMSGLQKLGAFVLLATNRPDVLDEAVLRDGRMDRKVSVPRPDRKAAEQIARIHLRDVPLGKGLDAKRAAQLIAEELFDESRILCRLELDRGDAEVGFPLSGIISGAMVQGVVNFAKDLAIRRDRLASPPKPGLMAAAARAVSAKTAAAMPAKPEGVTADNLTGAVEVIFRDNAVLGHNEALDEYIGATGYTGRVSNVYRLSQATK